MSSETSLSERLKFLRESRREGGNRERRRAPEPGISEIPGWKKTDEFVFIRDTVIPLDNRGIAERIYSEPFEYSGSGFPLKDLVFYDLETTGLSTGAGVIAFLAGFGRVTNGKLTVRQFFLSDFPGEGIFLKKIIADLDGNSIMVSYNGRSFDRNLLVSRSLMNRMVFPPFAEIDLLYTARRLWKEHLPSCTLSSIEQNILGIKRTGDVPGRYIPDIYFSFQKTGNTKLLERIFYHHLKDIESLFHLFSHIVFLWENPGRCRGDERYSLGRLMLSRGISEGRTLLEAVWEGDTDFSPKAGRILSFHYKRAGRMEDAERIWRRLWKEKGDPVSGLELAKYLEHGKKDYKTAAEITGIMLESEKKSRKELLHRLKRLKKKMDGSISR